MEKQHYCEVTKCRAKFCGTAFVERASLGTPNFASPVRPATAALVLLLLLAALLLTFFLRCHYASPPFPLREELLRAKMNLSAQLHQHKEAKIKNSSWCCFIKVRASARQDDS
jgi:hypothetical protein